MKNGNKFCILLLPAEFGIDAVRDPADFFEYFFEVTVQKKSTEKSIYLAVRDPSIHVTLAEPLGTTNVFNTRDVFPSAE